MKISTALRKIEKLEEACAQFRADHAASKDEPENQVKGWKPGDDAKTFLRQSCKLGEGFLAILNPITKTEASALLALCDAHSLSFSENHPRRAADLRAAIKRLEAQ